MKRFQRILAATDTRYDDHPIVAEAAEIAKRNNASLLVVDVVPEFPWLTRMFVSDHEHMRKLMAEEKQQKLAALVEPFRKEGLRVKTKVLLGKSSVEIIREVMRGEHDLVMRVAKGKESTRKGFFGRTGFQLLRKCPCAVWLVAPNTTPRFKHVMGCVDTSAGDAIDGELNDEIYELAKSISRYHNGRLSILQSWSIFNEQMVVNRLSLEDRVRFENESRQRITRMLDEFLQNHGDNAKDEHAVVIKGEASSVITSYANEHEVDLVVMGTVGRSGLSGMIMGNTAERILEQLECSVLAVKPAGFRSTIQLEGPHEAAVQTVFSSKGTRASD